MDYDELLERCRALPYEVPTEQNRLARFADRREEIEEHAAGVRPILLTPVRELMDDYLALARTRESAAARALYERMDLAAFVTRLLARRPLSFVGPDDAYLLRDGTRGRGGFDRLGTPGERPPLTLDAFLSYDEMAISALLGVSVPTHFINAGARINRAACGRPGSFEPRGVYVGLVGTRFERRERMEWRHMLVTEEQNTRGRGYGAHADRDRDDTRLLRLWARFYGLDHFPVYAEAAREASGRYLQLRNGRFLDLHVYRERVRMSAEAFLLEADARAAAAGRPAYVHVVGLGLGVWAADRRRQPEVMVEVYADVLRRRCLAHIADLDFSWFGGARTCGGAGHDDVFQEGGNEVRIRFSRRDPAERLVGEDAGKLLVAMYAWDSNAYPGNEYWSGALTASGDPAAACCSTIPELQNPDVNPRVSGDHAVVLGGDTGPWSLVSPRSDLDVR